MGSVTINKELCKGCGYCIDRCPKGVLQWSGESNQTSYPYPVYAGENCVACGICYQACPECAITVYR